MMSASNINFKSVATCTCNCATDLPVACSYLVIKMPFDLPLVVKVESIDRDLS